MSSAYLAAIGKRFGDAGLHELLVESGVIGPSAIDGVLSGKHYNQGLRAHKLQFEAFQWIQIDAMKATFSQDQDEDVTDGFAYLHDLLQATRLQPTISNVERITTSEVFEVIKDCLTEEKEDIGAMTTFWGSYLKMVNLLLCFIRVTREGKLVVAHNQHSENVAMVFCLRPCTLRKVALHVLVGNGPIASNTPRCSCTP